MNKHCALALVLLVAVACTSGDKKYFGKWSGPGNKDTGETITLILNPDGTYSFSAVSQNNREFIGTIEAKNGYRITKYKLHTEVNPVVLELINYYDDNREKDRKQTIVRLLDKSKFQWKIPMDDKTPLGFDTPDGFTYVLLRS